MLARTCRYKIHNILNTTELENSSKLDEVFTEMSKTSDEQPIIQSDNLNELLTNITNKIHHKQNMYYVIDVFSLVCNFDRHYIHHTGSRKL